MMPLFSDPDAILIKEYILFLKDELVDRFFDETEVRSICTKTNCQIELTNRILNRKVGGFKIVKYAIIQVKGRDHYSIRQCNRLLEYRFPHYRKRQEYNKKSYCCTLFQEEASPDNTSLYFAYQRSGPTKDQYGKVLLKSPFEDNYKRPMDNCYWKNNDRDLKKGIIISSGRQTEQYFNNYFKNCLAEQDAYKDKPYSISYFAKPQELEESTHECYRIGPGNFNEFFKFQKAHKNVEDVSLNKKQRIINNDEHKSQVSRNRDNQTLNVDDGSFGPKSRTNDGSLIKKTDASLLASINLVSKEMNYEDQSDVLIYNSQNIEKSYNFHQDKNLSIDEKSLVELRNFFVDIPNALDTKTSLIYTQSKKHSIDAIVLDEETFIQDKARVNYQDGIIKEKCETVDSRIIYEKDISSINKVYETENCMDLINKNEENVQIHTDDTIEITQDLNLCFIQNISFVDPKSSWHSINYDVEPITGFDEMDKLNVQDFSVANKYDQIDYEITGKDLDINDILIGQEKNVSFVPETIIEYKTFENDTVNISQKSKQNSDIIEGSIKIQVTTTSTELPKDINECEKLLLKTASKEIELIGETNDDVDVNNTIVDSVSDGGKCSVISSLSNYPKNIMSDIVANNPNDLIVDTISNCPKNIIMKLASNKQDSDQMTSNFKKSKLFDQTYLNTLTDDKGSEGYNNLQNDSSKLTGTTCYDKISPEVTSSVHKSLVEVSNMLRKINNITGNIELLLHLPISIIDIKDIETELLETLTQELHIEKIDFKEEQDEIPIVKIIKLSENLESAVIINQKNKNTTVISYSMNDEEELKATTSYIKLNANRNESEATSVTLQMMIKDNYKRYVNELSLSKSDADIQSPTLEIPNETFSKEKGSTKNHELEHLENYFKYLSEELIVIKNPTLGIPNIEKTPAEILKSKPKSDGSSSRNSGKCFPFGSCKSKKSENEDLHMTENFNKYSKEETLTKNSSFQPNNHKIPYVTTDSDFQNILKDNSKMRKENNINNQDSKRMQLSNILNDMNNFSVLNNSLYTICSIRDVACELSKSEIVNDASNNAQKCMRSQQKYWRKQNQDNPALETLTKLENLSGMDLLVQQMTDKLMIDISVLNNQHVVYPEIKKLDSESQSSETLFSINFEIPMNDKETVANAENNNILNFTKISWDENPTSSFISSTKIPVDLDTQNNSIDETLSQSTDSLVNSNSSHSVEYFSTFLSKYFDNLDFSKNLTYNNLMPLDDKNFSKLIFNLQYAEINYVNQHLSEPKMFDSLQSILSVRQVEKKEPCNDFNQKCFRDKLYQTEMLSRVASCCQAKVNESEMPVKNHKTISSIDKNYFNFSLVDRFYLPHIKLGYVIIPKNFTKISFKDFQKVKEIILFKSQTILTSQYSINVASKSNILLQSIHVSQQLINSKIPKIIKSSRTSNIKTQTNSCDHQNCKTSIKFILENNSMIGNNDSDEKNWSSNIKSSKDSLVVDAHGNKYILNGDVNNVSFDNNPWVSSIDKIRDWVFRNTNLTTN